jgi:pectinesterase
VVTVRNTLDITRPSETVELTGAAIRKAMPVEDLRTVHVTDDTSGREVVAQPVDLNDDGVFDSVIFQADLDPGAARTFTLSVGPRQVHTKDQFKAYGRFVRERRDDFAWENDRVAHRMYGRALETWAQ